MIWVLEYSPIIEGFGSLKSAKYTIVGIKIMHMTKKGQIEKIQYVPSELNL